MPTNYYRKHKTKSQYSEKWKKWRKQVFRRDGYTCQECGKCGGEIHPHHIISKKLFPAYTFRVMNGITLCKDCHLNKGVHKRKYNRYIRKYAKKTKLKLPIAKIYQIGKETRRQ